MLSTAQSGAQTFNHIRIRLHLNPGKDQPLKALLDAEGWGAMRPIAQPDGSWQLLFNQFVAYRDIESGAILDHWVNPLTRERVSVVHSAKQSYNSILKPVNAPPGAVARPFTTRFEAMGPWWVMRSAVSVNRAVSNAPAYVFDEIFQFFTSREAFAEAALLSLPSHGCAQRIGPHESWMRMDTHPGQLIHEFRFAKVSRLDALPADLLDFAAKRYPQFLNAPAAWAAPS